MNIKCYLCPDVFRTEMLMRSHTLFAHGKFVQKCSTGILEAAQRRAQIKFRRIKESMPTTKTRSRSNYHNFNFSKFKIFMNYIERGCRFNKPRRHVTK